MTATIPSSPFATTLGQGLFDTVSGGGVQGTAMPDPATRYALRQGILSNNETLPMWGGVGIYELVPTTLATGPSASLGPTVGRATALAGSLPLAGFSVFDQAYNMVNSPSSPVPLIGSYGSVMSYRLGSGARIWVACSPNLVNLRGEAISTDVSWDFTDQILEPYVSATVNSGTYNSATGAVSLTTATAHGLNPGDTFLPALTGTGSVANLNVEQVATAGTTGETLNFTAATGLTLTISGGSVGQGGILAVDVLDVNIGNSMTVTYTANPQAATWNYAGNAALIQI